MISAVLRKLGLIFAAFALFSIAGGHWAVLQTVAWAEMLRDYTQKTGSVAVAVAQTFDGQHPCELCLQLESAKQQQAKAERQQSKSSSRQQQLAKAEKQAKALPISPMATTAFPVINRAPSIDGTNHRAVSRAEQPPTPPPRRALA